MFLDGSNLHYQISECWFWEVGWVILQIFLLNSFISGVMKTCSWKVDRLNSRYAHMSIILSVWFHERLCTSLSHVQFRNWWFKSFKIEKIDIKILRSFEPLCLLSCNSEFIMKENTLDIASNYGCYSSFVQVVAAIPLT